ncbi:chloride channel [Blyttiomyces helicus]|uniref:Chloride channel n=1 Tax=Blyttiomyces helicus TaxID=388810 RepID=A0A4P9W6V9_9FUNG|nr:chloride channel [Blyttiomyces helicus]|eukprot:RKO87115.1 chloride channel [Blyttiomyces helicus]
MLLNQAKVGDDLVLDSSRASLNLPKTGSQVDCSPGGEWWYRERVSEDRGLPAFEVAQMRVWWAQQSEAIFHRRSHEPSEQADGHRPGQDMTRSRGPARTGGTGSTDDDKNDDDGGNDGNGRFAAIGERMEDTDSGPGTLASLEFSELVASRRKALDSGAQGAQLAHATSPNFLRRAAAGGGSAFLGSKDPVQLHPAEKCTCNILEQPDMEPQAHPAGSLAPPQNDLDPDAVVPASPASDPAAVAPSSPTASSPSRHTPNPRRNKTPIVHPRSRQRPQRIAAGATISLTDSAPARRIQLQHAVRANTMFNLEPEQKHEGHEMHLKELDSIAFEEPDGPGLRDHYSALTGKIRAKLEINGYSESHFLDFYYASPILPSFSKVHAFVITFAISWLYIGLFYGSEKLANTRIEHFAELIAKGEKVDALKFALWTCLAAALVPAVLIALFTVGVWTVSGETRGPDVVGSGMTELIAFLNGADTRSQANIANNVFRYLGILGISLAGLYSGIDGPFAMIGASVAIFLVQIVDKTPFLRKFMYREMKLTVTPENDPSAVVTFNAMLTALEKKRLRKFATLGAAVGITAIFRAPIGGVMFALEETTSFFEPSILIRTLFCNLLAYIVVSYQLDDDSFNDLEEPSFQRRFTNTLPTLFRTDTACTRTTGLEDFFIYILLACSIAILGIGWNFLVSQVQLYRQKFALLTSREAAQNAQKQREESSLSVMIFPTKDSTTTLAEPQMPSPTPSLKDFNGAAPLDAPSLLAPPQSETVAVTPVPHVLKWWSRWVSLLSLRLIEVALVCVITTSVVVLLPTAPGLDVCIASTRPLNHILPTAPISCNVAGDGPSTESALDSCLANLSTVCLPTEIMNEFKTDVAKVEASWTGRYLKELLDRHEERRKVRVAELKKEAKRA